MSADPIAVLLIAAIVIGVPAFVISEIFKERARTERYVACVGYHEPEECKDVE